MDTEKLKELSKETANNMKNFMEKFRMKASLAKMESKDTFQKMENYFRGIHDDLDHQRYLAKGESEEAKLQWKLGMMEAQERWDSVKGELNNWMGELKGKKGNLDEAKLQAHLAKMEARDEIENRLKNLRSKYDEKTAGPGAHEALEKLKNSIGDFSEELK